MSLRLFLTALATALLVNSSEFSVLAGQPGSPPAKERANQERLPVLVQQVYPVADLVLFPATTLDPRLPPGASGVPKPAVSPSDQAARLVQLITDLVPSQKWTKGGGPGSIEYHPSAMALSVWQTPDVQEQVHDLLTALRRLNEVNVVVVVRFFKVPADLLRSLDLDPGRKNNSKGESRSPVADQALLEGPAWPAYLDDREESHLLAAVQGNHQAALVQFARLMVTNGQVVTTGLTGGQQFFIRSKGNRKNKRSTLREKDSALSAGLRLSIQPAVTADRRFVRLNLQVELTCSSPGTKWPSTSGKSPESQPAAATAGIQQPRPTILSLNTTLTLPDSQSVLLGGWVLPDDNCSGLNKGRKTEQVVLLIKPTIVIPEEEEIRRHPAGQPPTPRPKSQRGPGGTP